MQKKTRNTNSRYPIWVLTPVSINPPHAARHHGGMKHKNTHHPVATLAAELAPGAAPAEFRLLPLGHFSAADGSGRPVEVPGNRWLLDAAGAARLSAASTRATRRVIDFEHQTLNAATNGQPAPAAGWIGGLEARADGLWAVGVEWTANAAAMIGSREYRYISPVFSYDAKTGAVRSLAHAALTNTPGLDGLTDLARLSAFFTDHDDEESTPMKNLLAALGLKEDADEEQAVLAVTAMIAKLAGHDTQIAALKAVAPDPALYVPMAQHAEMQGKVAALTTKLEDGERSGLMVAALADGRILGDDQKAYWGAQPLAALKAFLAVAQPVAALVKMQSEGKALGADIGTAALTADEVAMCAQFGNTPEAFLKTKQAAQAV